MTAAQREQQADAFLGWYARIGGGDGWQAALAVWAAGKGFQFPDFLAVKTIVHRKLLARGDTVSVDLDDYLSGIDPETETA